MPGRNHYPWCLCGWCSKPDTFSPREAAQVEAGFQRFSARRRLEAQGVTRSFTACFVEPNATCPVCSARVFYYQNRFGSRVFFDELGWPWPKHPCTDRATKRMGGTPPQPFRIRKRGELIEIAEAVKIVGFSPAREFVGRFKAAPWETYRIHRVDRHGFRNELEAEPLVPPGSSNSFFEFTSATFEPEIGQIFSYRAGRLSIIDAVLERREFQARDITAERVAARGGPPT